MSNTRKAKIRQPSSAPRPRCSFCRRSLGPGSARRALHLKTGQVVCAKCQEKGGEFRRLSCGHVTLPGSLVINENGDGHTFVCADCSTEARQFGNARFGLGRKA